MKKLLWGTGLVVFFLAGWALAGEGPGPIDEETKIQVREEIERYVKRDIRLKESFFILDRRTGEPLRLTFDYVHEGVKPHAQGYVSCVDFKDRSGRVYDVDLVVGGEGKNMVVREVFLHKVDGKPVTD